MKILFFNNIITPTNTPLFNGLKKHFENQGIDFKVIFTSATESNRSYDTSKEEAKFLFDYMVLDNKKLNINSNKDNHFFHLNFDIPKLLDQEKPDVIIHGGWAWLSAWTSLWWCKKNNAKFILWSGSTVYENSWRRTLTKPIVKYLIKKSDGFLSYGTRATEYLISLGASKEKIYPLYNTVDIDFFLQNAVKLQPHKEEIKKKYGIKTKYVLLFVGQLIKRKGVYEILNGFTEFQKIHPEISLVFAGSWQEQKNMEKIIQEQGIKNVFFPWFFQNDAISGFYTMADIFTLPSEEEVWGLVINEAMCFGLPVITAYQVGAWVDLVQEWKNGYIMKENSAREFEKWLEYIFEKGLVERNNSVETIGKFRVKDIVKGVKF